MEHEVGLPVRIAKVGYAALGSTDRSDVLSKVDAPGCALSLQGSIVCLRVAHDPTSPQPCDLGLRTCHAGSEVIVHVLTQMTQGAFAFAITTAMPCM